MEGKKTDWSRVERIIKEQREGEKRDEPNEGVRGKTIQEKIIEGDAGLAVEAKEIAINKIKKDMAELRKKTGRVVSEEDLKREDMEMRKRFGLI